MEACPVRYPQEFRKYAEEPARKRARPLSTGRNPDGGPPCRCPERPVVPRTPTFPSMILQTRLHLAWSNQSSAIRVSPRLPYATGRASGFQYLKVCARRLPEGKPMRPGTYTPWRLAQRFLLDVERALVVPRSFA